MLWPIKPIPITATCGMPPAGGFRSFFSVVIDPFAIARSGMIAGHWAWVKEPEPIAYRAMRSPTSALEVRTNIRYNNFIFKTGILPLAALIKETNPFL
jgi:hypothetical protein